MLYTEQHRELMRSVTKFVEAEINPHAEEWEKEGIFPAHALFRKMGQQGLLGIHKPDRMLRQEYVQRGSEARIGEGDVLLVTGVPSTKGTL